MNFASVKESKASLFLTPGTPVTVGIQATAYACFGATLGLGFVAQLINAFGSEEARKYLPLMVKIYTYLSYAASGLMILDEKGNVNFNLDELSVEDARGLNLNESERLLLNDHREDINVIVQSITQDMIDSKNVSFEYSQNLWKEYKNFLPTDVFTVYKKYLKESSKRFHALNPSFN